MSSGAASLPTRAPITEAQARSGGSAVTADSGLTVTDSSSSNLVGATVSISSGYISGDTDDSHSLLLPSGSSAYSSTVCFAFGDWHLRFFAKNVGSSGGRLHVQVIVPSLLVVILNVVAFVPGATIPSWLPAMATIGAG